MHERETYDSQAGSNHHARNVALATGAGGLGLTALFAALTDALSKTKRPQTNFREKIDALSDVIVPNVDVKVDIDENNEPSADKRRLIVKPNQADAVLAHELGHVQNYESPFTKWTMSAAKLAGLRPFTGLASGLYGALANRPSYVPAIAHLALSALALISEGAASLRAIPVLEQRSNWPRHAATLAVAFGTYAIPAFTPLAMTAVKRHLESADTIPMVSRRGTCQNTRGQYGRG